MRPPEEIHPEKIEMASNGSANEAPRGTRAKELNNAETGGRNDIMTMILANGASYDSKERVVLRRLSLEMRVEVGKRQQGREPPFQSLRGLSSQRSVADWLNKLT
jgi:hypothetical protein